MSGWDFELESLPMGLLSPSLFILTSFQYHINPNCSTLSHFVRNRPSDLVKLKMHGLSFLNFDTPLNEWVCNGKRS